MLASTAYLDRTMAFYANRDSQIKALTVSQVNDALKRWLSLDHIAVVVAGDFAKHRENIQDGSPMTRTSNESGDVQTTASGLKYRIISTGTGQQPVATSTVVCHYRGWLDNGQEFDNSQKRGEPAEFRLNQVIPGWVEGLQLIKEGGKIELQIPSNLGYGK